MIAAIFIGTGLVLGLIIGRWWALAGAVALGVWLGVSSHLEVSGVWVGSVTTGLTGLGIAAGVAVRRWLASKPPLF